MWKYFHFFLLFGLSRASSASDKESLNTPPSCPLSPLPVVKLPVVPGGGWDNLRNVEMDSLLVPEYTQAQTTPDHRYLVPDNVSFIPVRESELSIFSEALETWRNYSSLTAKTINFNGEFTFMSILSGGGYYSDEVEEIKRTQLDQKSVTMRGQARYVLYSAGLPGEFKVDPNLVSLVTSAVLPLLLNKTEMVNYLMEQVVRSYGTHFITRVDVGAVVSQDDFISTTFYNQFTENSETIKLKGSLKFFSDVFNISLGSEYERKISTDINEGYTKSLTSSKVRSFGGDFIPPGGVNHDTWVKSVEIKPVAVDRDGEQIHLLVTPQNFPNISLPVIALLRSSLLAAVERYYAYNTHIGCMTPGSPNFDFFANMEGPCSPPTNNYTFGGVFQDCIGDPGLCGKQRLLVNNFLTGSTSCPPSFTPFPLRTYVVNECSSHCHGMLWWRHCSTDCVYSRYTAFWCAMVNATVPPNTGAMFGGTFTPRVENPSTSSLSCPTGYLTATILGELSVCVGTDYEMGAPYALEFGGFFSCEDGNPLWAATENIKKGLPWHQSRSLLGEAVGSYPQRCPLGHTQHTAYVHFECLINYCVKAGSFSHHGRIPIVLPPFGNYTDIYNYDDVPLNYTDLLSNGFSEFSEPTVQDNNEPRVDGSGFPPLLYALIGVGVGGIVAVAGILSWNTFVKRRGYVRIAELELRQPAQDQ